MLYKLVLVTYPLDHSRRIYRSSSVEAPGLHDTNFNTLSIQTPRGQELLGHIKKEYKIEIAHEKGFKFHAQPQTGAYFCYSQRLERTIVFLTKTPQQ